MRIKPARYVACHEAGHAIVAINNGYHPLKNPIFISFFGGGFLGDNVLL
jgi:hypothetical protein